MTPTIRPAFILALAFLAGACVTVRQIQQTEPIRTMKFSGDHKVVAQCIHRRLGGKVEDGGFGESYVVYDAVKGRSSEGLTHYAITLRKTGPDTGIAEWRVLRTTVVSPGTQFHRPPPLSDGVLREFWVPVEDCTVLARAKASS